MEGKKARALQALSESSTITEAAQKCGLSRRTLHAYLKGDREFALAFEQLQDRILLDYADAICDKRREALETTAAIMNDESQTAAVRLSAAKMILAQSLTVSHETRCVQTKYIRDTDPLNSVFDL